MVPVAIWFFFGTLILQDSDIYALGIVFFLFWYSSGVKGLGKDGSGMVEPVQAQSVDRRAGLGSQQKKLDPSLEVQAGDSYKTLIHKKALARFREMS
jgi:hypothetical protein